MTRTDSVRAATDTARDSVRNAAEAMAPYAGQAKETAMHYAQEARARLSPRMTQAAHQARCLAADQYQVRLAPRIELARSALPPKVDAAAVRAAARTRRATRRAARRAADYTAPRVEQVISVAQPVREEAVVRTAAALAALRSGQVTARDITRLADKRARRARCSRTARSLRRVATVGLVLGGAAAAWKWWDRQNNPDWLVEPPAATELSDRASLTSVDGSGPQQSLDPQPPAEQSQDEDAKRRGDQP